ncbi:hypothetical protein [Streptomyces sporangiiformans]|uniref:hypothetical protein n=1 Tax=Streptomyces sporangiiformans TaxID=2315329 RepID=UPI0013C4205B|nr:hypothetical protein [Streptomyces sporangiiformans]
MGRLTSRPRASRGKRGTDVMIDEAAERLVPFLVDKGAGSAVLHLGMCRHTAAGW